MRRYPWKRLAAWAIDWLCILAWVAITAAVGIPLYLSGVTRGLDVLALNAIALVVMVVPVTVGLAALESTRRGATVGKRILKLRVVSAGRRTGIGFVRALGRNALKVALPWTIGHAVVFGLTASGASGEVPTWLIVATALAYALPILYVVSVFLPDGRTPYDRLARTAVVPVSRPARASVATA